MCGIAGILAVDDGVVEPGVLQRMNDRLSHLSRSGHVISAGIP